MRAKLAGRWDDLNPSLPWLGLAAALVLATMPAWRPMVFGVTLTIEDLTGIRCRAW